MQSIPEIELAVYDLTGSNSKHIDEYLNIYEELLPQYVRYAPVMRQRAEKPIDEFSAEKWHQWLLKIQDRPVGMIEFLYNRKRNTGLLLDFAIRPDARNIQYLPYKNLASLILDLAMQQLTQDAQALGHVAPLCMVTEVEHVPLVKKYETYGFVEFPIEYFEPPSTPELTDISTGLKNFDKIGYKKMYLGAFQIPGNPIEPNDPGMIKTVLLTLWEDHYRLPANHWLMQKMFQEIHI